MWIITNHWMIRGEHSSSGSNIVTTPGIFGSSAFVYKSHPSIASDDESVNSDSAHSHPPVVEWAYAFDIHLNALFPCIITLRIIQPIFFYCKFSSQYMNIFLHSTFRFFYKSSSSFSICLFRLTCVLIIELALTSQTLFQLTL